MVLELATASQPAGTSQSSAGGAFAVVSELFVSPCGMTGWFGGSLVEGVSSSHAELPAATAGGPTGDFAELER